MYKKYSIEQTRIADNKFEEIMNNFKSIFIKSKKISMILIAIQIAMVLHVYKLIIKSYC